MPTRLALGCMTGTSIDAIDVALVRINGHGLSMKASFDRGLSKPLGPLAPLLRSIADQTPTTAGQIADIAHQFSLAHAAAARELLGPAKADLICAHGQTVFHRPPLSWQLFNPWPLAHALQTPVVYDLRGSDLAAGGQGAPITPLADWILFADAAASRAIVNLGGFANATLLPRLPASNPSPEAVQGFDICACNLLLDAIARTLLYAPFDADGRAASAGTVHAAALDDLANVLSTQTRSGRSLGTGDEMLGWLSRWRTQAAPNDIAATACEALGRTIAHRLKGASQIYLAGGGARNAALAKAIAHSAAAPVHPLNDLGLPLEFREAAEFAVLGALCQDRLPITLPSVTGVRMPAPLAGTWAYVE